MAEKTFVYAANSGSNDISIFHLEKPSGLLRSLGSAPAGGPASSMAVSPDKCFLHVSVNTKPTAVETFAIDQGSGGLTPVAHINVPTSLTYLTMDANGWFLLGAAYHGHLACVMTVSPEGLPNPQPIAVMEPGIHPHAIVIDPSNRFACIPALGSDALNVYLFDPLTGVLAPATTPVLRTPKGSGPRHCRFSPDGSLLYLLTELSGDVISYTVDGENGDLEQVSSISIIPPTHPEEKELTMWAADIQITPDGRFVYASERTTSNLVYFKADTETGALTYASHIVTEAQPRGFAIEKAGKYLLAAGEKSHHVSCYEIDVDTGELKFVSRARAGKGTNWGSVVDLPQAVSVRIKAAAAHMMV